MVGGVLGQPMERNALRRAAEVSKSWSGRATIRSHKAEETSAPEWTEHLVKLKKKLPIAIRKNVLVSDCTSLFFLLTGEGQLVCRSFA